mmetsp:Transcript_133360/g.236014  ORF Transcript_133360/g.236014 Transcript_133360/m.236014 type:complete len:377 (+) Transcript_133360:50-1180(+)
MALLLDIHKTSARTLVRRSSAEPSWTVRDVFAAAAEIVRRGTNVCRLLTTDSQLIDEDSTITDMGLVPGVYQGWCWCPGFYTFYSLDLTEDGHFVLTRWVDFEADRFTCIKPILQNCKLSGHFAGNGVFIFDTTAEDESDCDIALQLCDDGRSVTITGPVENFVHHMVDPTRVDRKEVCMNLIQCHSKPEMAVAMCDQKYVESRRVDLLIDGMCREAMMRMKPERLTDLPGLLPQAQPLKFHDESGWEGGYSIEMQQDGSFQLKREDAVRRELQSFVITGRFDDTEFRYSLDPLDHSKQSGNITEKEMELAWSVLHMYIGDGGRVLLDGLRGPVSEQAELAGKPATGRIGFVFDTHKFVRGRLATCWAMQLSLQVS